MTPAAGGDVEAWIIRWRDWFDGCAAEWYILNDLLDDYRLHTQMGVPLSEDISPLAGPRGDT